MLRVNPNKNPSVSSDSTSSGKQVRSGTFQDKTVTQAKPHKTKEFLSSSEANQSSLVGQDAGVIRRSRTPDSPPPLPPLPGSQDTQASSSPPSLPPRERPSVPPPSSESSSPSPASLSVNEEYESHPQLPTASLSINEEYESHPQLPPDSQSQVADELIYDYVSHEQLYRAGSDTQAAGRQYETVDLESSGEELYSEIKSDSQQRAKVHTSGLRSAYNELYSEVKSDSQQGAKVHTSGLRSAYNELYSEVKSDSQQRAKVHTSGLRSAYNELYSEVKIHKEAPANIKEIAAHVLKETDKLETEAKQYIKELELDLINIMERESEQENQGTEVFQRLSANDIGQLNERVTEQHKLCIAAFQHRIDDMTNQLKEVVRLTQPDKALFNRVSQNIVDIVAMKSKLSSMESQLNDQLEQIKAQSFFEGVDMEKPQRPQVFNELMTIRNMIKDKRIKGNNIPEFIKTTNAKIKSAEQGAKRAKSVGLRRFAKALGPNLDKPKTQLKNLLADMNHCDQVLKNVEKDFPRSLRSMSATESTYIKELHRGQVNLVSSHRLDIHTLLKNIDNLTAGTSY